ncbi:DUF3010 family protein [Aquisalimonas asiatica]|uniref:DUF3010 family protein n=1 Tax=Aquisalimonas asiatica TaxID=406100 RepID=A0A1H8S3R2_9GAMM|nr:DUF3010 family protein [Aquisalimonas asiatica]SEO73232.1 Protein of unknown function [Aquisalimonas asiatica]
MVVLGVEFSASDMNYVAIRSDGNSYEIMTSNRMTLGGTRDRNALVAFQDAVKAVLNDVDPDILAIKGKPESGKMQAGAASLKMEAILLANTPCAADFVSGQRINQTDDEAPSLYAYLQPALRAAIAAFRREIG